MFEVRGPRGALIRRIQSAEHAERLAKSRPDLSVKPLDTPATAKQPQTSVECSHRGARLRDELCPTCHGTKVKVFACDVPTIGECQLGDKLPGVRSCGGCVERVVAVPLAISSVVAASRPPQAKQTACRVSVAIICHNYGRFLDECIDSVAASTGIVLHEVFVVDDASTDDTAEVCQRRGIKVFTVAHLLVHESRRTAYERSTGDVILFLDADDCVTPTYIADACRLLESDPSIGIVYSDMEYFGDRAGKTSFPDTFDRDELFRENYIHAGSLVRRDALRSSGAFNQPAPTNTHADWTLWKRIVRHGWRAAKQASLYRYRKHGRSMLNTMHAHSYYDRADLSREPITLFVPLSGRTELWPRMADQLDDLQWPAEQLSIVLLDTSQDGHFNGLVRGWLNKTQWPDVRLAQLTVGPPRVADIDRRDGNEVVVQVRRSVAMIYNWMRHNIPARSRYVLVIEDDNFPKSPTIIEKILRGFDVNVVSVAAPYLSAYGPRHSAWSNLNGDKQSFFGERGTGRQVIGGNGFGCVMLRRLAIREHHFADATHPPSGTKSADYDIDFYQRLHREHPEWQCLLDWSLECDHVQRISQTQS